MTNNEVLEHLSRSQCVVVGKVMQAVMNYWYIPIFAEQLSKLCSDKIWIDRLVDQPMADCTIAFCKRCKTIARSSETGESYFKAHIDITCTLQTLYDDVQSIIVENKNSESFKYNRRYRRLRGFEEDGTIIPEDRADTGFDSDSDGNVIAEDSILENFQELAISENSDDITGWSKLDVSTLLASVIDENEKRKNKHVD